MREILFRGKNDRGEWIEGFYIKDVIETYIYDKYRNTRMQSVLPETVGQYTGLTDKNGTKIFEGDIVQEVFDERKYGCFVVNMNEERCGWFPFARGDGCGCCEVEVVRPSNSVIIGNIHDNPELLNN